MPPAVQTASTAKVSARRAGEPSAPVKPMALADAEAVDAAFRDLSAMQEIAFQVIAEKRSLRYPSR